MPPLLLTAVQAVLLILLYLFLARAVRWIVRDVTSSAPGRSAPVPRSAPVAGGARRAHSTPKGRRAQPRELVVHAPGTRPRVVALTAGDITLGRGDGVRGYVEDPYVSEEHARVFRDGDTWMVVDAGSTNGTFLNQVRVTAPTPIAAGDQIALGKTTVEVRR